MTCALPTVFAAGENGEARTEEEIQKVVEVSRVGAIIIMASYVAYIMFQLVTHKRMLTLDEGNESEDEDDEDDGGGMTARCALLLMTATTAVIAVSSEILANTIKEVVEHCGLPERFI